jgi:hypothetical protein
MINMKTPTIARILLCVACFTTTSFGASAQGTPDLSTTYIDVFQDGTLFITYEEYLARQRRVEAAAAARRSISPPLTAPTRRPPVAVARTSESDSLREQWTIGAFR